MVYWSLWLGVLAVVATPSLPSDPAPLFLTPLLEAGDAEGARRLSAVPPLLTDCCQSHSGFLTVNKQLGSNMFFWFFQPETREATAPLVVWLQGGPGTSMMRTVLLENGPYRLDSRAGALRRRRRGAWTRSHAMLYFDNPVGTGYSFTREPEGYSSNITDIAVNLYEALSQFFAVFPDERSRDLYISGESFGGKMAVALTHYIHTRNSEQPDEARRMRLQGVIVINGVIEMLSQLDKSDIAYELGMVDESGRDDMKAHSKRQIELIEQGDLAGAFSLSEDECGGMLSPVETGMLSVTNMLLFNGTQDDGFIEFSKQTHVRDALHVGDTPFKGRAGTVASKLSADTASSVLSKLAELADAGTYRILVANGQLDMCIPYRLSAKLLRRMQWGGAEEWKTSSRVTWCYQRQLAGYARTVRNVSQVLVRNAGHYLGQDQGEWSADMLNRFTSGATFNTCELCYNNFK